VKVALVVLVAALAVGCSGDADPVGAPTSTPSTTAAPVPQGWSRILKEDAGLPRGASPDAMASDGSRALLVGADYQPEQHPVSAIWWSDDGRSWHTAETPVNEGLVYSAGIDGDVAFAAGRTGYALEPDAEPFLWRSEDAGQTFAPVDLDEDAFGPPAPEMGRPFVSQIVRRNGWWVASGGSSTGYAGVWISRTGTSWDQVLESRESGGYALVEVGEDSLMAWAGDHAWVTDDPTEWGEPRTFDVPERSYLRSVSADAAWALWEEPDQPHDGGTLLRSRNGGRTFAVDRRFATDHPGASITSVSVLGDLIVLAGYDRSTPGAWLSTDGRTWEGIPRRLRQPPGGLLDLTAEVDGQIVLFGTAPEQDRFYVYAP
jgi:hypothetical protein